MTFAVPEWTLVLGNIEKTSFDVTLQGDFSPLA
jgi:hypothetical protein